MTQKAQTGGSWTASFACTRAEADALADEISALATLDPPPTLVTAEVDPETPDAWRLDAYFESKPGKADLQTISGLLPLSANQPLPRPVYVPPADWLTLSQQGLDPVRAGRFHVHGSNDAPCNEPGVRNLLIDPAQAFGTGHHETTFGCLQMLDRMERRGARFSNIADIGTGTGLLAFAARHLWPGAAIIASDIDVLAVNTARRYAKDNAIHAGAGRGGVEFVTANGTDHRAIARRAPFDLVIANILAGPLTELAPAMQRAVAEGGALLLAGLLDGQRERLAHVYRRHGFRIAECDVHGDWPTLRLVRRRRYGSRRIGRGANRTSQPPGDFGEI